MSRWLPALIALWLLPAPGAHAEALPRQYVPPAGTVTLARNMPFYQAVQALSEISSRLTRRVIVDDRQRTFPIGVDIADMHWRDALDILLKLHGMRYEEQPTHIRIIGGDDDRRSAPGTAQQVRYSADRREVRIGAIFFEGDRRKLRDAGVNWAAAVKRGTWIQGAEHQLPGQLEVTLQPQQQQEAAASGGEGGGGEQLREGLMAMIRMLESRSVGEVLASPSIQVLDGEEGRIQVGQDFSIKQIDFAGNVTDNFISTGLILRVMPTVMIEDSLSFVHLSVTAERSSVSPGAVSTIVNKAQASTSLMLLDGERAAIAGLYTVGETLDRAGIPILKDLPWWCLGIRYLAGSTVKEESQKELVIILRADLVPHLASRQVDVLSPEAYIEQSREQLRRLVKEGAE